MPLFAMAINIWKLVCYIDIDFAEDQDRRSTLATCFMVALSTIEAEYMVDTHAYKKAIWLKILESTKRRWLFIVTIRVLLHLAKKLSLPCSNQAPWCLILLF